MTRIVVIDPQPAVRAGLAMMLRTEPGLVPVGAAVGAADGLELVKRQRPDVVLLDGGTISRCAGGCVRSSTRRGWCSTPPVTIPALPVTARVAGADGLVHKEAEPTALYEALRLVAPRRERAAGAGPRELDAAAHRVEPEDLALLAMLIDRTEPADVAATLRLDRRKLARRIERMLVRLRPRSPRPV